MTTKQIQYWAFRVDRKYLSQLDDELQQGRLRQGWGWQPEQNLRDLKIDDGAGRNLRMFKEVKKGDHILIPHLPLYGQITIAVATEDWIQGYSFSIWEKTGDHGHIFPVKYLRNFTRGNKNVPASLGGTFRNPCRFWKINHLETDIQNVLSVNLGELGSKTSVADRWHQRIEEVFEKSELREKLFSETRPYFSNSDWEYLLTDVLCDLNPGWRVVRTGGKTEAKHGTDILATIPDVFGEGKYGIAIQVKDYDHIVGNGPIEQILKAKNGYWLDAGIKIIEMIVVIIGSNKTINPELVAFAKRENVRLIWSKDVESLIFRAACKFMSDPDAQASLHERQEI